MSCIVRRPLDCFNPRSPRRERPGFTHRRGGCCSVSIHAPREGSDTVCPVHRRAVALVSIHAPREGSDNDHHTFFSTIRLFQSTLPAKGATIDRVSA